MSQNPCDDVLSDEEKNTSVTQEEVQEEQEQEEVEVDQVEVVVEEEEEQQQQQEQEEEQEQIYEYNNDNNIDGDGDGGSEHDSSVSSPIAISSTPSSSNMRFNSHVLVNVEEFVYYSVKLGIKFQLLNNNIVVGPYYDGEVPLPVAAMLEAIHSKADQEVVWKAQSTLQVSEAVEKEEETASLHALSREDFHVIRQKTCADDLFYCKGLLTANSKNTFLSYPATNPNTSSTATKKKRMPMPTPSVTSKAAATDKKKTQSQSQSSALRRPLPKHVMVINNVDKVFTRSRDGSISWEVIHNLTFSDTGALQETAEDAKQQQKQQQRGSRPVIHGTKPAKNTSADSFHINKKKQQQKQQSGAGGAPSNPLDTDSPTSSGPLSSPPQINEEEEEEQEGGEEEDTSREGASSKRLSTNKNKTTTNRTKSSSDQQASWADEQSADVMTYYINASAVSLPPAASASINLPEATATANASLPLSHSSPGATSQVGFDPRSPSLSSSSRSPAAYHAPGARAGRGGSTSSPVTIQAVPVNMVVTDNVPFDRPPSLSVQQEFLLRNGSIRSASSSSSSSSSSSGGNIINKASLQTGAGAGVDSPPPDDLQALDLSADLSHAEFHNDEEEEEELHVEREGTAGRSVASKVVVQCQKQFGDNIKKVWKFELPLELSAKCIRTMTGTDAAIFKTSSQSNAKVSKKAQESELRVRRIVELLVEKFSFPTPYWESTATLLEEAGVREDPEAEYFIQEAGSQHSSGSGSGSAVIYSPEGVALRVVDTVVVPEVTVHKMLVLYFDEDVDDFVLLDLDTLVDFTEQVKKALRVDYAGTKGSVIGRTFAPVVSVTEEEEQEEEKGGHVAVSSTVSPSSRSDGNGDTTSSFTVTPTASASSSTVVVPVCDTSSELSAEDTHAQMSPYGSFHWLKRRDICIDDSDLFSDGAYVESSSAIDRSLQQYYVGPQQWSTLVAVNGIRMKDLEKQLVFAMLKQRQRPLVLEFESRHGDSAATASAAASAHAAAASGNSSKSKGDKQQDTHIPASTFLAKYSHPLAKSLRKQVEKLLKNFDAYEWAASSTPEEAAKGSSPQVFVTSLYRSIESELENLGLFDSSTPQGGGVPNMTESHWADVRMHIETLVFNSIYDYVQAMAPPDDVYELSSHAVRDTSSDHHQQQQLRSMVPLQTKFAFLSFLTLKDMGMELADGLVSPCRYALASSPWPAHSAAINRSRSRSNSSSSLTVSGNSSSLSEEWRLGIKELCRATEMRSPLKIMQRLRFAVMLLTHAIEGLIGRPLKYTDYATAQQARKEAETINEHRKQATRNGSSGSGSDSVASEREKNVIHREFIRPAGYYNPVTLGADELMPVLSWAIMQANAPGLDTAVWLCGEFRHPSNHMGECAYTLTQVSSALEFVKAATWRDFEVEEEYFQQGLQRYELTQDLILACKQGRGRDELDRVRTLLDKGADVNGLSADQSDSPLSAAVKSRHIDVVKLLLEYRTAGESALDVNLRISPYFPSHTTDGDVTSSKTSSSSSGSSSSSSGGKTSSKSTGKKKEPVTVTTKKEVLQDYTALMVAAFTGQVVLVALLLDHGADRYLTNEAGDTASSLARTGGHREVMRVLLADPQQVSVLDVVAGEDVFLLRGLLLQEAVDLNQTGVICQYQHQHQHQHVEDTETQTEAGARHKVEVCGTVIHSAIYFRDVSITNILLNGHRVDVNKSTAGGETALMWCGASNTLKDLPYSFDSTGRIIVSSPGEEQGQQERKHEEEKREQRDEREEEEEDIARVQMACALLREQADRYTCDSQGRTAYHWAKFGNHISPSAAHTRGHQHTTAVAQQQQQRQHRAPGPDEVALEDLPFIATKCRFPRLAAVLYYDPSRYRIYHLARDGCLAGVRALLDQGVSINDSCPDGWYTPLIAAVYNKDVTMTRFLLQFSTIEVNFKGKHQTTALHYAAQEGHLSICGLLLFHNADRTALTSTGLLPIDFALSKGHKEIAACLRFDPQKVSICLAAKHGDMNVFCALINQGVSVNSKLRHVSEKGTHHELTTALISAVSFGQLEFIRQLVANKEAILANAFFYTNIMKSTKVSGEELDINATNFIGQTALMYASASGDEDMTLYLLKLGANRYLTDKEGRSAAKWAKQSNHPQLYMVLICDPAVSTVHEAIREGNIDATIAFFKQESNPNIRYFSSLVHSSPSTSTPTSTSAASSTSASSHASLNVSAHPATAATSYSEREAILDGESPLVVAAKYGRLAIVRLLFRAPEIEIDNVDTFGKTALMHACERGHESVVLLLLKQKSNRLAMCYNQKRAIDYAAGANQSDIVDILEADPYKVHIQDAAENGNARHVNALLKQGCPPNYQDERTGKRNRTALLCAASKGRLNVIKLLLSLSTTHSININLQDADGLTALMHAAKIGNLEVTGALLTAGAKRDLVDTRGKTAQSHANSHGFITGTQFKGQLMWR